MIIGKILKPQGVKGELKVLPLISAENDMKNFKSVNIDSVNYKVLTCRVHEGFAYMKLNGINSRNEAELYRNKQLEIERSEMPELKPNQYYIVDLIGCKLFDVNNNLIAKIIDVNNYGASDILVLRDGSEEILCPYVDDLFSEVNLDDKKIIINLKRFKELTESEN